MRYLQPFRLATIHCTTAVRHFSAPQRPKNFLVAVIGESARIIQRMRCTKDFSTTFALVTVLVFGCPAAKGQFDLPAQREAGAGPGESYAAPDQQSLALPAANPEQASAAPKDNSSMHPPRAAQIMPPPPREIRLPKVPARSVANASWRVMAAALSSGAKIERANAAELFDSGYADALLAVLSSSWRAGLKVDTLNSDAGEILAIRNDPPGKFVITLCETTPGKTRIAIGCQSGSREAANATIAAFLQICSQALPKQERI